MGLALLPVGMLWTCSFSPSCLSACFFLSDWLCLLFLANRQTEGSLSSNSQIQFRWFRVHRNENDTPGCGEKAHNIFRLFGIVKNLLTCCLYHTFYCVWVCVCGVSLKDKCLVAFALNRRKALDLIITDVKKSPFLVERAAHCNVFFSPYSLQSNQLRCCIQKNSQSMAFSLTSFCSCLTSVFKNSLIIAIIHFF